MDKMFAIIKVVALLAVVAVVISAHPMSEAYKDVEPFVSRHDAAILPNQKIPMKNNDKSWLEGMQNQEEETTTDGEPSDTTPSGSNSTTPISFATKPSGSIATGLLFSMLIIVPGVFFGMS